MKMGQRLIDRPIASALADEDVTHVVHGSEDLQATMALLAKYIFSASPSGNTPVIFTDPAMFIWTLSLPRK
jgi:hypothetical protein